MTGKNATGQTVDTVRASRGGHTFHERWAARRALQLVFPQDRLKAIAVEGLSTSETAKPGVAAEEIADLVLYYGDGENFATSEVVQTTQFKYKTTPDAVTASYLRKTIEKFAGSVVGYEKDFSAADVDKKLTFAFVTNADFSPELWEAIDGLKSGSAPTDKEALKQYKYLEKLCKDNVVDAQRLFSRCEFRASEEALPALNSALRRTIVDWSAGADLLATARVFDLAELVREKAGPRGQRNNLIRIEEVLVALRCEREDLFPAGTRFIDVGEVAPDLNVSDARLKRRPNANEGRSEPVRTCGNKKDSTALLQEKEYRSRCWGVSQEMSNAVTQTQKTVSEFSRNRFRDHLKDRSGNDDGRTVYAVDPRSFLVIGNLAQVLGNDDKITCFDLYRRNIRAPEILTFDELFQRASCIVENISRESLGGAPSTSRSTNDSDDDIPF